MDLSRSNLNIGTPHAYIDSYEFRSQIQPVGPNIPLKFYIEGVKCSNCLAKIQRINQKYASIVNLTVDMSRNTMNLFVNKDVPIYSFLEELSLNGFTTSPIHSNQDAVHLQNQSNRADLIRIGVATFCTMNIMLFVFSIYGGLLGELQAIFNWISFACCLPVVTYCSWPFYKNLWVSFNSKRPTIDLPIVFAIIIGFSVSTWHLLLGREDVYFDSLSTLVLLLLSSRYFLKRVQQNYLTSSYFLPFLKVKSVRIWDQQRHQYMERPVKNLSVGDRIRILKNEKLPADGKLLQFGTKNLDVYLDTALLTGEPLPVTVKPGQLVYAGTQLISDQIDVKVQAVHNQTRIGKIFESMEQEVLNRTPLISMTDRLASWFTVATLTIGIGFFAIWSQVDINEALRRSLALVILACPCALALATPLTQSLSLMKAARAGYIFKSAEALEKIHQITDIVFDKTGTLTVGVFEFLSWKIRTPSDSELSIIYTLEKSSKHPIGRALIKIFALTPPSVLPISHIKELTGVGVQGYLGADFYELKSLQSNHLEPHQSLNSSLAITEIGFYKNSHLEFGIQLGDRLKSSAKSTLQTLRKLKLKPYILSGDQQPAVSQVGFELKIPSENLFAALTPEEKLAWIKKHPQKTIMVGDGANDAAALAAAQVSIAVKGAMQASLKASDIYLSQGDIDSIPDIITLGKETFKIIRRNIIFSLIYNVAGGLAALLGFINPLIAAILMPISSLVVLSSSVWGTKALRNIKNNEDLL